MPIKVAERNKSTFTSSNDISSKDLRYCGNIVCLTANSNQLYKIIKCNKDLLL